MPIYLSSPAFNLVFMTSYSHFCCLQHIRNSAFPHVNPSVVLPSAKGSLHDVFAETYYFYAQNCPAVVTVLPRAGLALALLISSFSPKHLPGGLMLSDVDQSLKWPCLADLFNQLTFSAKVDWHERHEFLKCE